MSDLYINVIFELEGGRRGYILPFFLKIIVKCVFKESVKYAKAKII